MSAEKYEELVAAGAPRLPDGGYFYRVRLDEGYSGCPRLSVEIRRRPGRCLSLSCGEPQTVWINAPHWRKLSVEYIVTFLAKEAWSAFSEKHQGALRRNAAEQWVGDLP